MCKKCQKSKIGKMKRRRRSRVNGIDTKSIVPTLTTAALAAAGLYAANQVGKIKVIKDMKSGYAKAAIKVAGGIALTMMKNNYSTAVGVGMAASGVLDALGESGVSVNGIGEQRTWIAGVDSPAYTQQPVAVFQ